MAEKKYTDNHPIPPFELNTPLEFVVKDCKPIIKVDLFVDWGCPWCAFFYLDQWKKIEEFYFKNKDNKPTEKIAGYGDIKFVYHFMAAPYIPVSFELLKALTYAHMKKPEILDELIGNYCKNEKEVRHDKIEELNKLQIVDKIFELYLKQYGFDKDDYTKEMNTFKNEIFMRAAAQCKYSMYRGVNQTPTMLINDVKIEGRWDFDDWKKLFNKVKSSF